MELFYKKTDIVDCLTVAFQHRYSRKDVALTGILLARPEDDIAAEGILPHLKYWHYRSDYYTDFFCAGYGPSDILGDEGKTVVNIDGNDWGFSNSAFVEIVEDIEEKVDWHYRGDPCLLLLNSYFDGSTASLDFLRSIRLNFREAIAEEAISTPTELAEIVFEFAKSNNESADDPIWELSDHLGRRVVKRGLKEALLAWLPDWVSDNAKRAMHYAVHENRDKAA